MTRPAVIDVVAEMEHFRDHTLPVYLALPPEMRGGFYTSPNLDPGIHGIERSSRAGSGDLTLVCSVGDMRLASYSDQPRPLIFMEHGAGMTFEDSHGITFASYSGSYERPNVAAFLNVNSYVDDKNRYMHPHAFHRIIGSPKLDAWFPAPMTGFQVGSQPKPTVAIVFHWDCHLAPGTRSAYPHFRDALPALAAQTEYKVIGHAHPRMQTAMRMECATYGIEFVEHLSEVFERADLLIADATSAMYEFAALDRPVVVLNAPWYRQEADDGIRFWREIPGIEIDDPAILVDTVRYALGDPEPLPTLRHNAVNAVYPYRGESAARAVSAIQDFVKECR